MFIGSVGFENLANIRTLQYLSAFGATPFLALWIYIMKDMQSSVIVELKDKSEQTTEFETLVNELDQGVFTLKNNKI